MGRQFSIYLDESETRRLTEIAIKECRRPQDQVRYILRSVLMSQSGVESNKPVVVEGLATRHNNELAGVTGSEINMSEEQSKESEIWSDMMDLWKKLEGAKPADRSEQARRYAVTITEFQKVMGYFFTFAMQECSLEFMGEE